MANKTHQLLLFLLVFRITHSSMTIPSSGTWSTLRISPNELCSMPHGNFRVSVYEHADNSKSAISNERRKYYYAPQWPCSIERTKTITFSGTERNCKTNSHSRNAACASAIFTDAVLLSLINLMADSRSPLFDCAGLLNSATSTN